MVWCGKLVQTHRTFEIESSSFNEKKNSSNFGILFLTRNLNGLSIVDLFLAVVLLFAPHFQFILLLSCFKFVCFILFLSCFNHSKWLSCFAWNYFFVFFICKYNPQIKNMENAKIMHAHGVCAHLRNGVNKIKPIVNLSPLQNKTSFFQSTQNKNSK